MAAVALIGGGIVLGARWIYLRPGPLARASDIVVSHGTSLQVARNLRDAGLIGNAPLFRVAARFAPFGDGPLHAGEFHFPARASLPAVLAILRHGRPVEHDLTIPEGLTAAQIARLLGAAAPLSGADEVPLEGSLLPQTYAYLRGTPRAELVRRAEQAQAAALAATWPNRAPGLPLESPRDAIILASIVERETALTAERPHIAAVFLNRLRMNMKLQSDATVAFAVSGGLGSLGHPLSRTDLAIANPYNTYRFGGLPPGPICAPGLAAIQAVLQPSHSGDLYFVADGSGGHAFASTLEDHQRNVARWRALH